MYKSKYYKEKYAGRSNSITSFGLTIALIFVGVVALFMGIGSLANYFRTHEKIERCSYILYLNGARFDKVSFMSKTDDQAKRYRNSDVFLFKVTNYQEKGRSGYWSVANVKVEFCDVGDQEHVYDTFYSAEDAGD
jgi:hypothetical protein